MKRKTRELVWVLGIAPVFMLLFGPLVIVGSILSRLNMWITRMVMVLKYKFINRGES
jgi:hypothetical protein